MNTIDSINSLSIAEFDQQYFKVHRPAIHKGGVKNTQYFKEWSFDYLRSKCGEIPVKISHSKIGYYKDGIEVKHLPFATALDHFVSEDQGKFYYLQQSSIPDTFPILKDEIERPPWLLETDLILNQNLWVGGSGCVSPLHYDGSSNFLIQVKGRKKLILFAPQDYNYLYPMEGQEGKEHVSGVDLRNVDHDRFPLFKNATPYEFVLEPGDVLFIPSHWWHEVRSLDASISLNYWFLRFEIVPGYEHINVDDLCSNIQRFLDNGMSIDSKNLEGEIMLLKAINEGYANVVEALLKMGANANIESQKYKKGASALSFAKAKGNQEIISLLLRFGAKANS